MGATVYAGVLSNKSSEKLLHLVKNNKDRMRPIIMDVTKQIDIDKAVETIQKSGLKLQACVNNAGISAFGWGEALPVSTYERNMNVNFFGVVRMTRSFLPLLRASKGRLINMDHNRYIRIDNNNNR